MPNRLANEKSPYLLQHAHNPVDWYPWGEAAFQAARDSGKPIFLSIGYSTCHWCHVMERESFESVEIARLMNEHFINVKVDREERPDVDHVYMAFVQATTGGGGWPMSVFLTPELEPFYGGTYFPPDDRYGRPGFASLLKHISRTWNERRADLKKSGENVIEALRRSTELEPSAEILDRSILHKAFTAFSRSFDTSSAGFGQQPKFPRPVVHNFLLRYFARSGDADAARMVVATLGAMARGGIHDHLGGGFHRYSVDRYWHVPHFEKMLYDQGQLLVSLVEAYQVWPDAGVAEVARGVAEYVLRDLTDSSTGGFYSAEDADSPVAAGAHERAEGAFYVFTMDEIVRAAGRDGASLLAFHYGLLPDGNAEDPHGELTGKNVLHRVHTVADSAARLGKSPAETEQLLADARARLLALRNTRPRPHLDDKVLTAWNGLMISGLSRAAQVFGEPRWLDAASRAAEFIAGRLYDPSSGSLLRRYRDGDVGIAAYLDDYAMVAQGLIDLYQASFELRWLTLAEKLVERLLALFHDAAGGGFYATTGQDPSVLVRMKEDYDGAEPSGNSVATLLLTQLGRLLDRPEWVKLANETLRGFSSRLQESPHALPQMLVAFDALLDPPLQVVIAGEKSDPATQALLRAVDERFVPHRLVLLVDEETRAKLAVRLPHILGMTPLSGKPAAYVCRDWHCERPTTDPRELVKLLDGKRLDAER